MRVERVALEHHGDVAFLGRQVVHHPVANRDRAAGNAFQTGDHPEQCGLAAARGPDENHELTIGNVEVDAMQDLNRTVGLAGSPNCYLRHISPRNAET